MELGPSVLEEPNAPIEEFFSDLLPHEFKVFEIETDSTLAGMNGTFGLNREL